METRANYVVVGVFTLLAVLAAFGFVYWSARYGDVAETAMLRVRIPGSASGLGRGSAVLFNGVKVGDVKRVYIDVKNPTVAIADTEIDRLTPVSRSTLADIGLAGLTGQANIELKGVNAGEPNLLAEAEQNGAIAEITANPSAVTNLLQTAQTIFKRADAVLSELEGFTNDVRGPLTDSVNNAHKFTEALGRNSEGVDKFLASFSDLSKSLAAASTTLDSTLKAGEGLINAVDREKVAKVVDNVEATTARLRTASERLDGIMSQVDTTAASVATLVKSASGTVDRVNGVIDSVDPKTIKAVVDNVAAASQSARTAIDNVSAASDKIRAVADDVSKVTSKIGERSEDINQIVTDARLLSGRLAAASSRLDNVMASVDSATRSVGVLATNANGTLSKVNGVLDSVDPSKVRSAIDNVAAASETVRTAASDVSKVTSSVGDRAADINQVITDARLLSGRLAQASVRIDGVIQKVDALLGSGQAQGLFADASATLKAIRQVADQLNARLPAIADNFARFSGQGLNDVRSLVNDSQRSVNRIEQAITDLSRNPQRILTGGDGSVREYDGRARR